VSLEDDDTFEESDPEEASEYFTYLIRCALIVTFTLLFGFGIVLVAVTRVVPVKRALADMSVSMEALLFIFLGSAVTTMLLALVGFFTTASKDAKRWFTGAGLLAVAWACVFSPCCVGLLGV